MLSLTPSPEADPLRPPEAGRRGFWGFAAAFFLLATLGARGQGFTAALDRDNIYLGESATLTLTFSGGVPSEIPALSVAGLQVSFQGKSQQILINGAEQSASTTFTFNVIPSKIGQFTLPALQVQMDGQTYSSPPLKLTVLKPGAAPPGGKGAGGESAFIRLVLPKHEVFVGETFPGELQIYLKESVGAKDFQMAPMQAEGFTTGKMTQGDHRQVRVGNFAYNMTPLAMTFTAAKAGTLTLGPASCSLNLLTGPMNFFGQPTRQQQVTLTSDPVTVRCLPLPAENRPAGFNGAVGSFAMNVTVSPTNIAVGDPITVKVQISGRGAVDSVTLPDQTGWDQFKLYPPTSSVEAPDQAGLTGTKNFALTVVPQNMDIKELPPFAFSFFDPDQKAYRTLSHAAVPLTVRPSTASLPPPVLSNLTAAADTTPPPAQDIVHIKPRIGVLAQAGPPVLTRPWFLALQGVPVLAWLSLLVTRKQKERLANNPRLRRQRQVERTIRSGLEELRAAAAANEAETFFATLFRLLQEQLGERLDCPASSITEAVLDERLRTKQTPEGTLALLRELFQACNQARYGRASTHEELASWVPKLEEVLAELKKLKT